MAADLFDDLDALARLGKVPPDELAMWRERRNEVSRLSHAARAEHVNRLREVVRVLALVPANTFVSAPSAARLAEIEKVFWANCGLGLKATA